jgi:hypothetical protein
MILQDAKRNKRGKPLSMARTRNADEADRYVYKKCAREENTRKSARDSIGADTFACTYRSSNEGITMLALADNNLNGNIIDGFR